jgi:hypothetical protein
MIAGYALGRYQKFIDPEDRLPSACGSGTDWVVLPELVDLEHAVMEDDEVFFVTATV